MCIVHTKLLAIGTFSHTQRSHAVYIHILGSCPKSLGTYGQVSRGCSPRSKTIGKHRPHFIPHGDLSILCCPTHSNVCFLCPCLGCLSPSVRIYTSNHGRIRPTETEAYNLTTVQLPRIKGLLGGVLAGLIIRFFPCLYEHRGTCCYRHLTPKSLTSAHPPVSIRSLQGAHILTHNTVQS